MERVEGIEPSHQPWQGRRLPLHHTRFKMVDRKRIELFPKACKAPVLPLSLTAHKIGCPTGFEPIQRESKSLVLPLHHRTIKFAMREGFEPSVLFWSTEF